MRKWPAEWEVLVSADGKFSSYILQVAWKVFRNNILIFVSVQSEALTIYLIIHVCWTPTSFSLLIHLGFFSLHLGEEEDSFCETPHLWSWILTFSFLFRRSSSLYKGKLDTVHPVQSLITPMSCGLPANTAATGACRLQKQHQHTSEYCRHSSKQFNTLWDLLGCCRMNWSTWRYHWGSNYNWWWCCCGSTFLARESSDLQQYGVWKEGFLLRQGLMVVLPSLQSTKHHSEWAWNGSKYCFSEWLPTRDKTSLGETVGRRRNNVMLSCKGKICDCCNLISRTTYFITYEKIMSAYRIMSTAITFLGLV